MDGKVTIQAKERSSQMKGSYRVPPKICDNLRSLVGKVEKSGAKAILGSPGKNRVYRTA